AGGTARRWCARPMSPPSAPREIAVPSERKPDELPMVQPRAGASHVNEPRIGEGHADDSRVEVYLDGSREPFAMHVPPARFEIDTTRLDDGVHTLRFVASDGSGRRGVRSVSFTVRNGPGIAIDGVREGDVVDGRL